MANVVIIVLIFICSQSYYVYGRPQLRIPLLLGGVTVDKTDDGKTSVGIDRGLNILGFGGSQSLKITGGEDGVQTESSGGALVDGKKFGVGSQLGVSKGSGVNLGSELMLGAEDRMESDYDAVEMKSDDAVEEPKPIAQPMTTDTKPSGGILGDLISAIAQTAKESKTAIEDEEKKDMTEKEEVKADDSN